MVMRRLAPAAAAAMVAGLVLTGSPGSAQSPGEPVGTAPIEPQLRAELAADGTATYWVYLAETADLSPATGTMDRAAQGRFVYEQLTQTAADSQAGLIELLERAGAAYRSFWIANTVKVTGDAELLERIAARPEVAQVTADRGYEIPEPTEGTAEARVDSIEWGIDRIRAPDVWDQFGARGAGIVVGTIDTGAEFTHPALVEQYRGNRGGGEFDHDYHWHDPSRVCGNPSLAPCDNHGHGTHVTGTIVGDDGGDNQIGVAPEATWIAAKGCETRNCSQSALLSSGQFILAPTDLDGENPDPSRRPHIVNNSWGSGANADPWYQPTVHAWVAAGIFPQFANGNDGPVCGSAGNPGNLEASYAAGAFDIDDTIAAFSSRGPSARGGDIRKPNIAAPGVNVRSSAPGGRYVSFSGTSMASPHVAGAVALMWSAAMPLQREIEDTRQLLDQTAVDVDDTSCGGTPTNNNVWGQGTLDAFAAVAASPRGPTGLLTGVVTDAAGGDPVAGARLTVEGDTRRERTTGADGTYSVTLPVGRYEVSVAAFGYQPQTATVDIVADQTTREDFPLSPPAGARLHLAPELLDFDEVPVNRPSERLALTLTGVGSDPVIVHDVLEPDRWFLRVGGDCGTPPFTLAHLGSCTLDYEFDPTLPGPAEAVVELRTNAVDGPHRAALRGVGTSAEIAERWVQRFAGAGRVFDAAHAARVSPDGSQVYVGGESREGPGYATVVAYDADSGQQRWLARYNGPDNQRDRISALEVSPDGSRVFVTGFSVVDVPLRIDRLTIAYDARTGDQLWVSRHRGSFGRDLGWDLSVSPDGSHVYVVGDSRGDGSDFSGSAFLTIAHDAETGKKLWVEHYQGPGAGLDVPQAVATSPDGGQVYVTGRSRGGDGGDDYATVAYQAATGSQQWVARYDGPAGGRDWANALGVGPDGAHVYVTGQSVGDGDDDYATVAYQAATGAQQWVARYDGPAGGGDAAHALAVGPDGSVYVTGQSVGVDTRLDYATVAYRSTGAQAWASRYDHAASSDIAHAVDLTSDGSQVVVTGQSWDDDTFMDYATLAYDTADGRERWLGRYDGPGGGNLIDGFEVGRAVAVSPDGSQVFVTGESGGDGTGNDIATVAYDQPVVCDAEVAGVHEGPLTVTDGVTCVADGARVIGPVTVQESAGLVAGAATMVGGVGADGAAVVQLSGTRLVGPVTVRGTTGSVVISASDVSGPVSLLDNRTGTSPVLVSGNLIRGTLRCLGNEPAPVDEGEPNTIIGRSFGQCADM